MSGRYISPTKQCDECPYEREDLFTGTAGFQTWGWYCMFKPQGGGKKSGGS